MRVLVAEPSAPIAAALRKFLAGVAEVQVAHYLDEAVQSLRASLPDVVIASVSGQFDGEVLTQLIRKQAPQLGTIVVYPPEEERAAERAQAAGADSFLVGPLKKGAVLAAVKTVMTIRALRLRVSELEFQAQQRTTTRPDAGQTGELARKASTTTNVVDDSFFKKFLLIEIKRSKRYQYPVSMLIVTIDGLVEFLERVSAPQVRKEAIRTEVMTTIGSMIRDIDIAYPFADNRYLVFLAHTPGSGARVVAERIRARMGQLQSMPSATVSAGLAVFDPKVDPKANVSFGSLVKEATQALQKALAAGGNQVEGGQPAAAPQKKSRISLG